MNEMEELLALLGAKELQILHLKKEIERLRAEIAKATEDKAPTEESA
jgi:uncharacterized small protein (DUF1192 family)